MINRLFGKNKLIEQALEATWTRNEAVSHNIANVDTPGYKSKTVNFENYLRKEQENRLEIRATKAGHINMPSKIPDIKVTVDNNSLSNRLDGNNVDIENEMALSAKNQIKYNVLIQSVSKRYNRIKSVISEGRR